MSEIAAEEGNPKTEPVFPDLADDTGELDYEPSEPDNSIKGAVSEDENEDSVRSQSPPPEVKGQPDDDLEEGEVDELEDGEVKEEEEDDEDEEQEAGDENQEEQKRPAIVKTTTATPKLSATDPQNVKRVSEMLHTGDVRPEDVGICKFYIRGQCTWGNFCKFLHPGVNERGAYQMHYDSHPAKLMNKPVAVPLQALAAVKTTQQPRVTAPAPSPKPSTPTAPGANLGAESAWERGLKQAREMMRKANEKKETDVDFEEKRVNMPMDSVEGGGDANERDQDTPPAPRQQPFRSTDSSHYGRFGDTESPREPVPLMQHALMEDFDVSSRSPKEDPLFQQQQQQRGYIERSRQQQFYGPRDGGQQRQIRRLPQMQMQQQLNQRYYQKFSSNGNSAGLRQPMKDYGYERRQKYDYNQDKGRPLPYERPSYESKEWRDPWMRSTAKNKLPPGGATNDYTEKLGADKKTTSKHWRRPSVSRTSSSSSRSSKTSKTKTSRSASTASSSSSRSVSSISSGSSSPGSRNQKSKNHGDKKLSTKGDNNVEQKSQPPKSYAVRSISPISRDSESPMDTDEHDPKRDAVESAPPARIETAQQRKPIKMTILNKSKVQVPLAYEDELLINSSKKFEPLSPAGSSSSSLGKRKLPPPADLEDISPQETDEEEEEELSVTKETGSVAKEAEDAKTVSSRREELLKQLKAVEEAIAKKRTKTS